MNIKMLKAQLTLNSDTIETLAKYIGISTPTLSYKINGKTEFSRDEIKKIKDKYKLSPEKIDEIFFN